METPRPRVRGGLAEITEQVLAELAQNRVPTPAYGVALCGRPLWNGDHGYTQDMVPRLQPACLSSEDGAAWLAPMHLALCLGSVASLVPQMILTQPNPRT